MFMLEKDSYYDDDDDDEYKRTLKSERDNKENILQVALDILNCLVDLNFTLL